MDTAVDTNHVIYTWVDHSSLVLPRRCFCERRSEQHTSPAIGVVEYNQSFTKEER